MSTIPKQEDIITGMDDLFRMKEMLQQPETIQSVIFVLSV